MTQQQFDPIPGEALYAARENVRDILSIAIEYTDAQDAVVVSDARSPLATALTGAYRHCLPRAQFIDFDTLTPEAVLEAFRPLAPSDLVVLIQSTNFRLEAFRIRVELFKRALKVIEHPHLGRMIGPQALYYLDSLAYDPAYYRGVGRALKDRIDRAKSGTVAGCGETLVFASPFESAKLNIGDYAGMKNVGGQFPIGEVFTEARDLEAVNGRVRVAVFGDTTFTANKPVEPLTLIVERGRVAGAIGAPPEFEQVLANIRADEGEIWVRELGFGMNRALTPDRMVSDIGTFERMCGVHLSLGAKHGIFKKNNPLFKDKQARHHVDVFAAAESVTLDEEVVYQNGAWQV